jgi:hypothetical protein
MDKILPLMSDWPSVGGLGISNGGNSTFTVSKWVHFERVGNMGDDANNNVTFTVNGALNVSGTIYGKIPTLLAEVEV